MGMALLRKIEWCGRVSHRTEEVAEGKGLAVESDKRTIRFIKAVVMGHGDWSIVEHACITTDAVVDRGVTHEWVRHRIGAYTQESTRFVNYAKKHTAIDEHVNPASFICPPSILEMKDTEKGW